MDHGPALREPTPQNQCTGGPPLAEGNTALQWLLASPLAALSLPRVPSRPRGCTSKCSPELNWGEVTQRLGPRFIPSDHRAFSLLSSMSRDHTHGSSTWALTLAVRALWVRGKQTLMRGVPLHRDTTTRTSPRVSGCPRGQGSVVSPGGWGRLPSPASGRSSLNPPSLGPLWTHRSHSLLQRAFPGCCGPGTGSVGTLSWGPHHTRQAHQHSSAVALCSQASFPHHLIALTPSLLPAPQGQSSTVVTQGPSPAYKFSTPSI